MKDIIDKLNLNCKQFSELYEIPYMTVNQWYNGKRTPPKWVIKLFNELIESKKKGEQISIESGEMHEYYDEERLVYRAILTDRNEEQITWFNQREEKLKQKDGITNKKIYLLTRI